MASLGCHFENNPELIDLEDPYYYLTMEHRPDKQVVVNLSRIAEKASAQEKIRWLDLHLSHMQCPYPIKHIEFTYTGDAVVQFISETALKKALGRSPLVWENVEVATRPCTEEDIRSLFWVGVSGTPVELYRFVVQALQQFGEVRGQYGPHFSAPSTAGMLKYYFVPNPHKRLPPTIQFIRPDRPNGFPPTSVKVFTPHGPLSVKCSDFGKSHAPFGCPDCFRRRVQAGG